jgi:Mg2+ and Co2+ transporter CorA
MSAGHKCADCAILCQECEEPKAIKLANVLLHLWTQWDQDDPMREYLGDAADELIRMYDQLEKKSDAIQRLWKERDELRTELKEKQ